ncbi:unnamed protein product [Symbiodinium sp. CCMP2592]|nr:unnamed protein product [Symbiodinium sp. CCMP2592]
MQDDDVCMTCVVLHRHPSDASWEDDRTERSLSVAVVAPPSRRGDKEAEKKSSSSGGSSSEKREDRGRHHSRRRGRSRGDRARSKSSGSEQTVPEPLKDTRKPAEPKHGPKAKSQRPASTDRDRCPICWQSISRWQSGREQHMHTNATCLAWQIYGSMKEKNWKLAVKQGKELKEHRAREASKSKDGAARLVSKESRDSASKAVAAAAEWVSGQPTRLRKETRSRSRSQHTKKPRRRQPSPTPSSSEPPAKGTRARSRSRKPKTKDRFRQKASTPSSSSPEPARKRGRGRKIIINVT